MSRDSPAGNADEHAMVVDDEPAVPSEEEEHTALLAKAYFDLNEFQRAAHALRGARHPRSRFLRWYALFLAGEKHKDEEAVEDSTRDSLSVPSGKPRVVNKQLAQLQSELQPASDEGWQTSHAFTGQNRDDPAWISTPTAVSPDAFVLSKNGTLLFHRSLV